MHVLDRRIIRSCCELAIDIDSGWKIHLAFEDGCVEFASEAGHDCRVVVQGG